MSFSKTPRFVEPKVEVSPGPSDYNVRRSLIGSDTAKHKICVSPRFPNVCRRSFRGPRNCEKCAKADALTAKCDEHAKNRKLEAAANENDSPRKRLNSRASSIASTLPIKKRKTINENNIRRTGATTNETIDLLAENCATVLNLNEPTVRTVTNESASSSSSERTETAYFSSDQSMPSETESATQIVFRDVPPQQNFNFGDPHLPTSNNHLVKIFGVERIVGIEKTMEVDEKVLRFLDGQQDLSSENKISDEMLKLFFEKQGKQCYVDLMREEQQTAPDNIQCCEFTEDGEPCDIYQKLKTAFKLIRLQKMIIDQKKQLFKMQKLVDDVTLSVSKN